VKITHLERKGVRVPFVPGILSPPEYEELTDSYPKPIGERLQDIYYIHTDTGHTGLGMGGPYFEQREEAPPELIGLDVRTFEPRSLGGGGWQVALLDLLGKDIGWVPHLRWPIAGQSPRRLLDSANGCRGHSSGGPAGGGPGFPRHQDEVHVGRRECRGTGFRHSRGGALDAHRDGSRSSVPHTGE